MADAGVQSRRPDSRADAERGPGSGPRDDAIDSGTLHEEDIEAWGECQIEALRRLAVMPGPWANAIDWENVIEEIEDAVPAKREAVESLLEDVFVHILKLLGDPESLSSERWRNEVRDFMEQVRRKAKPSMRQRIGLETIWQRARRKAARDLEAFDRRLPEVVTRCPYSFDEISDGAFDPLTDLRILLVAGVSRP